MKYWVSSTCQTVNLSNQTLVVSDVSGVWENLFRSSGSPGFPVPNSEPHGTTRNRLEATSPKVIPACVRLLHTTPFSHTFYLTTCQTYFQLVSGPYIYILHTVFSLSHLASFWQLAEVCFHTYCFGYYTYCISLGIAALYLGEF